MFSQILEVTRVGGVPNDVQEHKPSNVDGALRKPTVRLLRRLGFQQPKLVTRSHLTIVSVQDIFRHSSVAHRRSLGGPVNS